ncbi:MAG: flavin monoamine oxidase family protein [Rubricoccaceae bacterium]
MPLLRSASGRTPLFAALRQAARRAAGTPWTGAAAQASPPVSRRAFLRSGALVAGGALLTPTLAGCLPRLTGAAAPRIAVVGAGLAGLAAAWHLHRAGLEATVYEASARAGGRVHTGYGVVAEGQPTELGAEFIDSAHADVRALCTHFGLALLDRHAGPAAGLRTGYFFGGRHYSERDVVTAFTPAAGRVAADLARAETDPAEAARLDRRSVAAYLDGLGLDAWLRALLGVAFVTEYGLDEDEQSALNFLYTIGTDLADGFAVFGESDERFKIAGGNERLPAALAGALGDALRYGHFLEAVRAEGAGFRLAFQTDGGARELAADVLVLALPLPLLRALDLRVPLPGPQRRAFAEAGFGTNAKTFAGMRRRPWRAAGFSGETFSDEPFQLLWDPQELEAGEAAGLTFFSGGTAGLRVGEGPPEAQVARLLPGAERAFPGTAAAFTGRAARFHWPSHAFTRGSYTCFRPGQWTGLAEHLRTPAGALFFAGEHCSLEHQGYMNGAAESGREAAVAIARRLRRRLPPLALASPAGSGAAAGAAA